jgi:hypothetical protein
VRECGKTAIGEIIMTEVETGHDAAFDDHMALMCQAFGVGREVIEQWIDEGKIAPDLSRCLVTTKELLEGPKPPETVVQHRARLLRQAVSKAGRHRSGNMPRSIFARPDQRSRPSRSPIMTATFSSATSGQKKRQSSLICQ